MDGYLDNSYAPTTEYAPHNPQDALHPPSYMMNSYNDMNHQHHHAHHHQHPSSFNPNWPADQHSPHSTPTSAMHPMQGFFDAAAPQQQQQQQPQSQQQQRQNSQQQNPQQQQQSPQQAFDYQPSVSEMSASRPTSSDANWHFAVNLPQQTFAQESQAQYAPYMGQTQPEAMFADFTSQAPNTSMVPTTASSMAVVSTHRHSYGSSNSTESSYGPLHHFQHDLNSNLSGYQMPQQVDHASFGQAPATFSVSPQETTIDNFSASSPSDNGWQIVDYNPRISARGSFESFFDVSQIPQPENVQAVAVANPASTLHIRTGSDETSSPVEVISGAASNASFGSYEHEPIFPLDHHSPEAMSRHSRQSMECEGHTHASSPSESAGSTSPVSPGSVGSFGARKRKQLLAPGETGTKVAAKKGTLSQRKDAGGVEKKVGRRKGPLRPEQRRQAGEIRKLRACLRCRFLKKTCDTGDPCTGCQPSHARLWQVPCTRIDIRDLHFFVKAFRDIDFSRHVKPGSSALNIVGFGEHESPMYITHGFGFALPIQAREIVVKDSEAFKADWVETAHEKPLEFEVETMALTVAHNGLTSEMAKQYLDEHINKGWSRFVDQQFQGTKFWTEMLKTIHKFWLSTKQPILKHALDMVLAYNLTQHICWADGMADESCPGKVIDPESKYRGMTAAPVFINFHVKAVFAEKWREAQKAVLEKLSELWTSFYSGEKAKNWPVILMATSALLIMWEEMEFDANYRMEDQEAVRKFRTELSSTPIGVIVGLFSAMCQKYPAFADWDSEKHGGVVNNDTTVCSMLEEVRGHIHQYSSYLEDRQHNAKFNREDFDSLCNKYVSRLILRKT